MTDPLSFLATDARRALEELIERKLDQRLGDRASVPAALTDYLTVAEAAETMRAKPQRIYDLVSARRLPHVKDGSRTLIRRSDLEAYLHEETVRTPPGQRGGQRSHPLR